MIETLSPTRFTSNQETTFEGPRGRISAFYKEFQLTSRRIEHLTIQVWEPDSSYREAWELMQTNTRLPKLTRFKLGGKIVLLGASSGFDVREPGNFYRTGSPGSEAKYAAILSDVESQSLVLVQVLRRYGKTSFHGHLPYTKEIFTDNLLDAPYFACLDNDIQKVDGGLSSKGGQKHMMFTLEEPSLSVVQLFGDPDHIHDHGQQPQFSKLKPKALEFLAA